MPWLLPANDEGMDFFNTLTLGNLSRPLGDPRPPEPSTTLKPWTPRRPSSSSHVREDRRGVGRLPSVKGFNKTMYSSLGKSNRCMMVRSSPKLFWNGVPDRIIRFLVQSSARTFQISLFGRPLLKFIQKGKLSYPGHHSKIILEDFVMPLLLPANDETMGFFNTLTLGNLSRPLGDPRPLEPSTTLEPSTPRRP